MTADHLAAFYLNFPPSADIVSVRHGFGLDQSIVDRVGIGRIRNFRG